MLNLFEKRATEFFQHDESLIAAVTPAPLSIYLKPNAGELFDRLVMISGTPGSGKTTVARLIRYGTVESLLRHRDQALQRPTQVALAGCGFLKSGRQTKVAAHISLDEAERDYWELPYDEALKDGLLRSMLQARSCIAWIKSLVQNGQDIEVLEILMDEESPAAIQAIGGPSAAGILRRAEEVEQAIYDVTAALIAPSEDKLPTEAVDAYRPFDVIQAIRVGGHSGTLELQPLIVFDDAHVLHPNQFAALERWLINRHMNIARWIMTRIDALSAERALHGTLDRVTEDLARASKAREITEIRFQAAGSENRREGRTEFKKMARDMSSRYFRLMPVFQNRGFKDLDGFLSVEYPRLSKRKSEQLKAKVAQTESDLGIGSAVLQQLRADVNNYAVGARQDRVDDDLRDAMYQVLLSRYAKRNRARDMFDPEEEDQQRVPAANADVEKGARIHLLHEYQLPYYFGFDAVCDIGSENAELFLQIAARLVDQVQTRLIRNRQATLTPSEQNRLLREQASSIVGSWNFPESNAVKSLVNEIGRLCLARTLEKNAPLGAGANAVGIPQEEFAQITARNPYFAKVLQYAVAYKAVDLVFDYNVKHRHWCLFELGGAAIAHFGLPLYRGGFVEAKLSDLIRTVDE